MRADVLLVLLVLMSLGATTVAPTKSELEAMYSAAARDVNAGHYGEALKKLDAIDVRQPDMAAAKNLRGVVLLRVGEHGLAERALQKARELDPSFWEARFNLAEVPFLRKRWAEARQRFEALAEGKSEQAQGATGELIQFKILLTYLMQGKEKKAIEILDQLKESSVSPAYYYGKAALAFRRKDETEAKAARAAAEKTFSAGLNKLFAESFYEVGWLKKADGALPVALEVTSLGERVARAQADFGKAERAFRERDYEGASELLDQVDAAAPNQAASFNLRGETLLAQGKLEEAQAALNQALAIDPQFAEARHQLARIPLKKGEYAAARKQLEALLGATSGGKQQRPREQLIRFEIFLTLLLEGRDGPAQKAMDEFKMMDETPALYYAQAAWAFQHGNTKQANDWIENAGNLYAAESNAAFEAPIIDLGWIKNASGPGVVAQSAQRVGPAPSFRLGVLPRGTSPETHLIIASTIDGFLTTSAPDSDSVTKQPEIAATDSTPEKEEPTAPTPEASSTPREVATVGKSDQPNNSTEAETTGRKAKVGKKRASARSDLRSSAAEGASSPVSSPPASGIVEQRTHQNLGDKVARLLLYPFKTRKEKTEKPAAASAATKPGPVVSPSVPPMPPQQNPRKN
ncbi:MAG: tetratricopeptide repeat protein [Chthoniobacterales bacterium]|nr:tetratricopeptide repeat protein [Chthoniobacterales bacterium]